MNNATSGCGRFDWRDETGHVGRRADQPGTHAPGQGAGLERFYAKDLQGPLFLLDRRGWTDCSIRTTMCIDCRGLYRQDWDQRFKNTRKAKAIMMNTNDRDIIRRLAAKLANIAALPVQQEKNRCWIA
jgi:hypothetical protein